jgi:hypothetical protein
MIWAHQAVYSFSNQELKVYTDKDDWIGSFQLIPYLNNTVIVSSFFNYYYSW